MKNIIILIVKYSGNLTSTQPKDWEFLLLVVHARTRVCFGQNLCHDGDGASFHKYYRESITRT